MRGSYSYIENQKTWFLICSVLVFLWCCKSVQTLIPGNDDVKIAQARWQTSNLDELTKGYNIYENQCTDCHDAKEIKDYSETDWIKIMKTMGRKAKLDSTQYTAVLHYILTKRQTLTAGNK